MKQAFFSGSLNITMARGSEENKKYYEVGYLLLPTVPAEDVAGIVDDLTEDLEDIGGEVENSVMPEMRELAYAMEVKDDQGRQEFAKGQFGWLQFRLSSEETDKADDIFANQPEVLRHLLLAIDPDQVGSFQARKQEEEEAQADKAEIDEKLDELVTEES